MSAEESHDQLAARLRQRVLTSGSAELRLREGAFALGAGGVASIPPPFAALAEQIGVASYRVTDEQVEAVRSAVSSEKAAFEVIMSASVGAGLRRWDAAVRAIDEASGASS